ncbi:hypothetical protein [Zafaria cholistanensis]|nr:hypothetical protein [Zafaria cholistanensis]
MRSILVSAGVGGALLLGAGPAQADPAASDAAAAQAPAEEGSAFLQGAGNSTAGPASPLEETPDGGASDAAPAAQEGPEDATQAPQAPEVAGQETAGQETAGQDTAGQETAGQEDSVPSEAPTEVSPSLLTGTVELLPVEADTAPGGDGSPAGNAAPDSGEGTVPDVPSDVSNNVPTDGETGTPANEPIRIGDRLFDPEDFNIPAGVASDPALLEEWLLDEANLDLLLESEGMLYLMDLMTELLLAGDWEGLEALFLDLLAGDEEAVAELIGGIRGMFEFLEEAGNDGADAGTDPASAGTGAEAGAEEAPAAVEPAAGKTPARLAVTAAGLAAPLAHSAALAETGAGSTAGIAAGGFSLVLAGAALTAWRRRTVQLQPVQLQQVQL